MSPPPSNPVKLKNPPNPPLGSLAALATLLRGGDGFPSAAPNKPPIALVMPPRPAAPIKPPKMLLLSINLVGLSIAPNVDNLTAAKRGLAGLYIFVSSNGANPCSSICFVKNAPPLPDPKNLLIRVPSLKADCIGNDLLAFIF